jgi:hypothetical protein
MALDFTRISYVESNDALTKSPEGCYGSKSHRGDLMVYIKVMTFTAKIALTICWKSPISCVTDGHVGSAPPIGFYQRTNLSHP